MLVKSSEEPGRSTKKQLLIEQWGCEKKLTLAYCFVRFPGAPGSPRGPFSEGSEVQRRSREGQEEVQRRFRGPEEVQRRSEKV